MKKYKQKIHEKAKHKTQNAKKTQHKGQNKKAAAKKKSKDRAPALLKKEPGRFLQRRATKSKPCKTPHTHIPGAHTKHKNVPTHTNHKRRIHRYICILLYNYT